MFNFLIIVCAHILFKAIKVLKFGSGSTWPGHIALKLNPKFIKDLTHHSKLKVILIAGTNGKTTTSKLISFILEKKGFRVFQNEEGANLLNGVASSLIRHISFNGRIEYDYGIFEIDENNLPKILLQVVPESIIVLNLFRDQLDRYGEVNSIAAHWKDCFKMLDKNTNLILNGDDPQIYFLGQDTPAQVHYFGLEDTLMEKKDIPHDVDSIYCPVCATKLSYEKMSYSHLGQFFCPKCEFKRLRVITYSSSLLQSSLKGVYNYYNISAAFLFLQCSLGISELDLSELVRNFTPAFGRQELIEYENKKIFLLLSKNPTGFNQSIEVIKDFSKNSQHTVLIALNDRIPDGRDISWIWDVEFQNVLPIAKNVYISGDRSYDMALRFKYCFETDEKLSVKEGRIDFAKCSVIENIEQALHTAIKQITEGETLVILATYSAMLEIRQIVVGRKLL